MATVTSSSSIGNQRCALRAPRGAWANNCHKRQRTASTEPTPEGKVSADEAELMGLLDYANTAMRDTMEQQEFRAEALGHQYRVVERRVRTLREVGRY